MKRDAYQKNSNKQKKKPRTNRAHVNINHEVERLRDFTINNKKRKTSYSKNKQNGIKKR
jgi:hypothetical protein